MPTTQELQRYMAARFPGYRIETRPYASGQGVIRLFDPALRLISELITKCDEENENFPEISCEEMGQLIAAQVVGQELWLKDPALAKRLFEEAGATIEALEGE